MKYKEYKNMRDVFHEESENEEFRLTHLTLSEEQVEAEKKVGVIMGFSDDVRHDDMIVGNTQKDCWSFTVTKNRKVLRQKYYMDKNMLPNAHSMAHAFHKFRRYVEEQE